MKPLVIIGAGGLGSESLWVATEMGGWDCLGFADDDSSKGDSVYGKPLLGRVDAICDTMEPVWFHCAIGNNQVRARVFERFEAKGWAPASLIHPNVAVGPNVRIGAGSYIGAGCVLCPNASTGKGAVVNCQVLLGHDSMMGDFSQACPGVRVNGYCKVGEYAFLGSNASLRPGVSIGAGATLGANSLAIRNIAENTMAIGVPARTM